MLRVFRPALIVRSKCRTLSTRVPIRSPVKINRFRGKLSQIHNPGKIGLPERYLMSSSQNHIRIKTATQASHSQKWPSAAAEEQFIEQFQETVRRAQMQMASYNHVDLWTADKLFSLFELCPIGSLVEKEILILLQALGAQLVERLPEERREIFDKLWTEMDKAGVIYTTTIFNQRMQTMMDNRAEFNPVHVLNEMNNLCIPTNRRTYQLMIQRYCLMGHLDEAQELFDKLKKEKIAISPKMYQAVMSAHILQGNEAGAEKVLESSYSQLAQINSTLDLRREPSTYAAQVVSLAAVGKLSSIQKVLESAKDKEIELGDEVFYFAIIAALEHEHTDLVPEIMDNMLKFSSDHYLDLKHLLTWLINHHHDYIAVSLIRRVSSGGDNFFKHLMRCMVLRKRSVKEIMEMGEQFSFRSIKELPTSLLLWSIWLTKDPKFASEMLFHLPKTDENLGKFWKSLFSNCHRLKEAEDILKVARFIVTSGNSFPVASFFSGIMVPLKRLGFDYPTTLKLLKSYGLRVKENRIIQRMVDLEDGTLGRSEQFMKQRIFDNAVVGMFGVCLASHKDPKKLFQLLVEVLPLYENREEMLSKILLGAVKVTLAGSDSNNRSEIMHRVETVLYLVKQHDLVMLKKMQYPITAELAKAGMLSRYLEDLVVSATKATSKRVINFDQIEEMSLNEVENLCKSTAEPEAQAWLLVKLCEEGMVERAQELEKELKAKEYLFPALALKALAMMYVQHVGDIEQALVLLAKLESDHPSFRLYVSLIIKIAELLVKDGDFASALDVLTLGPDFVRGEGAAVYHSTVDLYEVVLQEFGVDSANKVMSFLINRGFIIGKYRKDLADHVTIAMIKREDSDGVLKTCRLMHETLGVVPMSIAVCNYFISTRQDASLKEVMDLMSTTEPLNDVRLRIIALLVETGNMSAAIDLTTDPDFRENSVLALALCKYFLEAYDDDNLMKEFVNVLKVIPGRKDTLLCGLIDLYDVRDDWRGASAMVENFKTSGIMPTIRCRRTLDQLLRKLGQPGCLEDSAA